MSEPSEAFQQRQGDMDWRPGEAGLDTSPEAVRILRTKGVQAWRAWVAEQQAKESDDDQA